MKSKNKPRANHKKRNDTDLAEQQAERREQRREEKKELRILRRKSQRRGGHAPSAK